MKSDEAILRILEQATQGLMFMSESDFPFETVCWNSLPEITPQHLLKVCDHPAGTPVEVVSLDSFFGAVMTERDGQNDEARASVKRFQNLAEALKCNLEDVKVYKVGTINMPVYIVGRSSIGSWIGLSTRVVET